MTISLNGESVDSREARTIAELIDRYQLPPQSILVEHNGLAVHRHEWADRPLSEGDRVEFIRVVAGGKKTKVGQFFSSALRCALYDDAHSVGLDDDDRCLWDDEFGFGEHSDDMMRETCRPAASY